MLSKEISGGLVSFIVPLYKTPSFFVERIILNALNTSLPIKFIFINDSGYELEYMPALLQKLENSCHGYLYKSNVKNLGITASYCEALKECDSKYFGILDHDDEFIISNEFENIIVNEDFDVIFTNESKFTANGHTDLFSKPDFDILSSLFYFYPHHFTLYKTEALSKIRLLEAKNYKTCFDIWLWANYIKSFDFNFHIKHVESVAYGWRIHEASTASNVHQKNETSLERISIARELFNNFESDFEIELNSKVPYAVSFKNGNKGLLSNEISNYMKLYNFVFQKNGKENLVSDVNELVKYFEHIPLNFVMKKLVNEKGLIVNYAGQHSKHPSGIPNICSADSKTNGLKITIKE